MCDPCLYCLRSLDASTRTDEHAMSRQLGGPAGAFQSDTEDRVTIPICLQCRKALEPLEERLTRDSIEAGLRVLIGAARRRGSVRPYRYQRQVVSEDDWDGAYVVDTWENDRPVATLVPQAEFPLEGRDRWEPLRRLKERKDGELAGRFNQDVGAWGANQHECDLVVRELRRLGIAMRDLYTRTDRQFPKRLRTYDTFAMDRVHRRLIYKIAFGTLACVVGPQACCARSLDESRRFVKEGYPPAKGDFQIRFIDHPEDDDRTRQLATTHVIETEWTNQIGDYADLSARVTLYGVVEYRLTLAWCVLNPAASFSFRRTFDLRASSVQTERQPLG
jgi:hypothetical protein